MHPLVDTALSEMYDYDSLNRLVSSERADDYDQAWTLDGAGNFSAFDDDGDSQTRSTDGANQITVMTGGWITPTYDAAGNMISGPQPGAAATQIHYVFDAWNRLVAVKFDDSGAAGDTFVSFQYDGLNRRIQKTRFDEYGDSLGGDHYYYNLDWQIVEDRWVNSAGTAYTIEQYVWAPSYVDSPIVSLHDGNADGDASDSYSTDWRTYYTTDVNHNVTATLRYDNDNEPVWIESQQVTRNVYTPYGVVSRDGADAGFDGPLYCGYFYDCDTGLYQVRNRYYDPGLSTWISRDPVGYNGADTDLYRYVVNQPTTATDPSGLAPPWAERETPTIGATPAPGSREYEWRHSWDNPYYRRYCVDQNRWAVTISQESPDNAEKRKIRGPIYAAQGSMIGPWIDTPRQDTQLVLKLAGGVPVVGIPPLAADAAIHFFNKEYEQGLYSAGGAGLNGWATYSALARNPSTWAPGRAGLGYARRIATQADVEFQQYADRGLFTVEGQAHHLNQTKILGGRVPYANGITTPLAGDALLDVGSQHFLATRGTEAFFDLYRPGTLPWAGYPIPDGPLLRSMPTFSQYNRALYNGLQDAGVLSDAALRMVMETKAEQLRAGFRGKSLLQELPRRVGQRGGP